MVSQCHLNKGLFENKNISVKRLNFKWFRKYLEFEFNPILYAFELILMDVIFLKLTIENSSMVPETLPTSKWLSEHVIQQIVSSWKPLSAVVTGVPSAWKSNSVLPEKFITIY